MNRKIYGLQKITFLLSLCVVITLIYMNVFRNTYYLHQCMDDECVVCHHLQLADGISKNLLPTSGSVPIEYIMPFTVMMAVTGVMLMVSQRTLVADKVRIDR